MRIVSLLASATEIVCSLGAGDSLVGRSHECDNPPWVRSLPPCSEPAFDISVSSHEIDAEVNRRLRSGEPLYRIHAGLIRELAPDLVIAQSHCEVCAVTPGDVERSGCEFSAGTVLGLTAGSLEGIFESIGEIARAIGKEEAGRAVIECERQRLAAVREKTANRRMPSVVMLEWADPVFAMGNWGPELVEMAHGELLLGSKNQHSRAIPGEQVLEADPEYVIVAPCGFNLERACAEAAVLEAQPWWDKLRAARTGKVAFADGNLFFNRSGMTISRTAEILAEILHGVVFGTATEDVHWRWIGQVTERVNPRLRHYEREIQVDR
jgi:iron complex transport system substrate-binding protein